MRPCVKKKSEYKALALIPSFLFKCTSRLCQPENHLGDHDLVEPGYCALWSIQMSEHLLLRFSHGPLCPELLLTGVCSWNPLSPSPISSSLEIVKCENSWVLGQKLKDNSRLRFNNPWPSSFQMLQCKNHWFMKKKKPLFSFTSM